jgi:regulator of sigma E protease
VSEFTPDSPAEKAGLKRGDQVVALNGVDMPSMQAVVDYLQQNKEKPLVVNVLRDGQAKDLTVTPLLSDDGKYRIGFIASTPLHVDQLSLPDAFRQSLEDNKKFSQLIFTLLQKLVEKKVSIRQMDGPIGIGRAVTSAVQQPTLAEKTVSLVTLMAMISLNLGIFNLLPIPILDGGLILLTTIEGIMRRDFSERLKDRIYLTAFVFLLIFAAVVLFNDVS